MTKSSPQKTGTKKGAQQAPTAVQIMEMPVNNIHTRRIVEFTSPMRLFVEIDQHGRAHQLGATHLQGHFQVGMLAGMQQWTPAQDQSDLSWKQTKGPGYIVHLVQRQQRICNTNMEIALVQHYAPTPAAPDINLLCVTPLWDKNGPFLQAGPTPYQALSSYTCYLMLQCGCAAYTSMLRQFQAHYGNR